MKNRKKFRILKASKSIAFQLFLCFFAVWLPFSAVVMGGLYQASRRLTQSTIDNRENKLAYYSVVINRDLDRIIQLLYTMCGDSDVVKLASQRDGDFAYSDYLDYLDAYTKLKDYRQISMYIDDIFLYLPKTNEALTVNSSIIPVAGQMEEMIREYRETGREFYIYEDNMQYVFQGANEILMGITVSVRHITNTLKTFESQMDYDFFLVDAQDSHLLGERLVSETARELYAQTVAAGQFTGEVDSMGKRYIMEQIHTIDNHFDIVIFTEKDVLYQDVYYIRNIWLLINAAAVLVPVLMAWIISGRIHKPMKKLVAGLEKVEQEIYDFRLPLDEASEFQYVFQQYNSMAANMKNLIQEVYEKQLQVQEARFLQLQTQINPHFLFNSFYMGYRMAKAGDTERVAQLCMYLGDYFKVLTYFNRDAILLHQDVKFIRTYLQLNQMRFEDKLEYHVEVEDGLEEMMIPHLMIQPVIENCICHGVEKVKKACHIELQIRLRDEWLEVSVSDDCGMMTAAAIAELEWVIHSEFSPGSSIGLWNIQQRLDAMEAGSIRFELQGARFTVSYRMKGENANV